MKRLALLSIGFFALQFTSNAYADPRKQAQRIYMSLSGVTPTDAMLDQLEAMVKANKPEDVAAKAMDEENFLRVTVAHMAKRWTNKQHLYDFDLSDYSATVIGVTRDDVNAKELLTGDIVYTAADGTAGVAPYSPTNNTHYKSFQDLRRSYKTELVRKTQSTVTGLPIAAGVMTLRGFGAAFYFAGTNRAAWEAVAHTFLGKSLRAMHDVNLGQELVRRDVDRCPGGASAPCPSAAAAKFQSECVGCHGGMDAMARAFAHFDWDQTANQEKIVYTPNSIPAKMNRNSDVYPYGNLIQDDNWVSLYQNGINSYMGFEGPFQGDGIQSLGQFVASSRQFSRGLAHHVFVAVCDHEPVAMEQPILDKMAQDFTNSGFKMKSLFSNAAIGCKGE